MLIFYHFFFFTFLLLPQSVGNASNNPDFNSHRGRPGYDVHLATMVQAHRIVDILFAWCQLLNIKLFFFQYTPNQYFFIQKYCDIINYIYNLIAEAREKIKNINIVKCSNDNDLLSNTNSYEEDEEDDNIHESQLSGNVKNLPDLNLLKIMCDLNDPQMSNNITIADETMMDATTNVCYISENHDSFFFIIRDGCVSLSPIFCDYIKFISADSNEVFTASEKYKNIYNMEKNNISMVNLKFINRDTLTNLILKISNLLIHPIHLNVVQPNKIKKKYSVS